MRFRSTRVSNELGAGNPHEAQAAVCAGIILTAIEAVSIGVALFCFRYVLGYAFSNEKEVVDYVAEVTPFVSLMVVTDGLQALLSGLFPRFCPQKHCYVRFELRFLDRNFWFC